MLNMGDKLVYPDLKVVQSLLNSSTRLVCGLETWERGVYFSIGMFGICDFERKKIVKRVFLFERPHSVLQSIKKTRKRKGTYR